MAQTDIEILQDFGEKLMNDTKEIIPDVSGRTRDSLRMENDGNILTIFGASHIGTLEFGRKRTRRGGAGFLIEAIKEWLQIKGLDISPFAVARNIHKYGNTLNRIITGVGPVNYIANPIGLKNILTKQKVDFFKQALSKSHFTRFKSEIIKEVNKL